jgi:polyhydroxyalkanoate synthesis regulator phasin
VKALACFFPSFFFFFLLFRNVSSGETCSLVLTPASAVRRRCLLHTLFDCIILIIMAEALGLTASVIAVIDLSAKVASRCSKYYADVKNTREDIERLQREAQGLEATLIRVQSLCDAPNGMQLHESQSLCEGVEDCKKQLAQLENKLEPRTRNKFISRCGIRALRWPLEKSQVDGIIDKLRNCRDNISFSLQVDQEYVVSSII